MRALGERALIFRARTRACVRMSTGEALVCPSSLSLRGSLVAARQEALCFRRVAGRPSPSSHVAPFLLYFAFAAAQLPPFFLLAVS